jgi:hypothetical protein
MSVALNPAIAPTFLTGSAPELWAAGHANDGRLAAGTGHSPRSLDDLLAGAVQQAGATSHQHMAAIQAVMPVPELFDEGEDEMINLQNQLGDFSIAVSLQSALARKAVGAIETLIKS